MGEPLTRRLRRVAAFAVVVALHAGLVVILVLALRTPDRPAFSADFISTFILISVPQPTGASASRRRSQIAGQSATEAPLEPLIPPPPPTALPITPDASIDWGAEAEHAAAAVTSPRKFLEFGHHPSAEVAPRASSPAHEAGDQYRLQTGEWIVWVSDSCYIISGVPPLGMPDVIARSIPARTVCKGDSTPQGELFKDLPAYRKYHPR